MTGFFLCVLAAVVLALALFLAAVFGRSVGDDDSHEGAQRLVFWASVFLAAVGLILALCV